MSGDHPTRATRPRVPTAPAPTAPGVRAARRYVVAAAREAWSAKALLLALAAVLGVLNASTLESRDRARVVAGIYPAPTCWKHLAGAWIEPSPGAPRLVAPVGLIAAVLA